MPYEYGYSAEYGYGSDVAGASAAFSPSDIAGLVLWLDANQIVGLNDGDSISTWADQSGNGYDATGSGGTRPVYKTGIVNGLPVARFTNGSSQYLTSTAPADSKPFSVFAVMQNTSPTVQYNTIIGASGSGGFQWRIINNGNGGQQQSLKETIALIAQSSSSHNDDTWYLWGFTYSSGGVYTFYLDNAADGTGTNDVPFASTTIDVGRNGAGGGQEYCQGDIAEIVLYDSVLSSDDRNSVSTYLADKYGITI